MIEGDVEVLVIWYLLRMVALLRVFDILMVLRSSDFIKAVAGVALIGFPGDPGRKRHLGRLRILDGLVFMKMRKIKTIFFLGV